MMEHLDVAATLREGYPVYVNAENQDNEENRRTFAEEHIKDFIDYAMAGDPDIIANFAADHTGFKKWLN